MPIFKSERSVYFGIIWWAWRLLGALDLTTSRPESYRYWSAVLVHLLVTAAFPVMLVLATLLPENLTELTIFVTSAATSAKFLIYVQQLKKVTEIEQLLAELDAGVDTEEQRACQAGIRRTLSIITRLFKWTYLAIGINSNVSFVFRDERSLPFSSWFPLDWSTSLINYSVAVSHQILAISMQILQNFVDDLFPPLALILIAGQCELLVLRLSAIGHDESDQRSNERKLINCIRDQEKIYRLHRVTMEIVSWPLLVQFIVIAFNVGAALCSLLFYVDTMSERLYNISLISALALQIFPVCYYGTHVEYSFARLQFAVYSSNWVDQSIIYRKNAIIFAERTQRLPKLIAGHFIPIALTTFLANCKAAYSFCTLIADTGTKK